MKIHKKSSTDGQFHKQSNKTSDKNKKKSPLRRNPSKIPTSKPNQDDVQTIFYNPKNILEKSPSVLGSNLRAKNNIYDQFFGQNKKARRDLIQSNQSSTHCSFTNKSLNNTRSRKNKQLYYENKAFSAKKKTGAKQRNKFYPDHHQFQQQTQSQNEHLFEAQEVMLLINCYATKIQRQWRAYWFRKCLSFIILKKKQERYYANLKGSYHSIGEKRSSFLFNRPSPPQQKRFTLPPKIQQECLNFKNKNHHRRNSSDPAFEENFGNQLGFNYEKYASLSSFNSQNIINSTVKEHVRTGSGSQSIQAKLEKITKQQEKVHSQGLRESQCQVMAQQKLFNQMEAQQRNSDKSKIKVSKVDVGLNCSLELNSTKKNEVEHNQSSLQRYCFTPINELEANQNSVKTSTEQRKMQIKLQPRVYQAVVKVELPKQTRKSTEEQQHRVSGEKKKGNVQKPSIHSSDRFEEKFITEQKDKNFKVAKNSEAKTIQMFQKCCRLIQLQKSKSIKELNHKYTENQITHRTYERILKQQQQKHSKQLKLLKMKQSSFRNTLKDLYEVFKQYLEKERQNSFVSLTEEEKNFNWQEDEGLNTSLSFDRWDFESSAKKSLSQLESFQEFAKELNEKQIQNIFKTNKRAFSKFNKHGISPNDKSIQRVLEELDKLQEGKQKSVSGRRILQQLPKKKHVEVSDFVDGQNEIMSSFQVKDKGEAQKVISFQKKVNNVQEGQITEKNMEGKDILFSRNFKKQICGDKYILKSEQFLKQPPCVNTVKEKEKIQNPDVQLQVHKKNQELGSDLQGQDRKGSDMQGQNKNLQSNSQNSKAQKKKQEFRQAKELSQSQVKQLRETQNSHFKDIPGESLTNQHSEVEIKITSINAVQESNYSAPIENVTPQTQQEFNFNFSEQASTQVQPKINKIAYSEVVNEDDEQKAEQKRQQQFLKEKQRMKHFYIILVNGGEFLLKKNLQDKLPSMCQSVVTVFKQLHYQTKLRRQQQLIQLAKYPETIDPTIDAINSWLLEICHFILDHHNYQIQLKLLKVKSLPSKELLTICRDEKHACSFFQEVFMGNGGYQTISQKTFKEFEFFYIKNVFRQLDIPDSKYENFSTLLYSFHRCLVDCMNLTLLEELSIGKNWVILPWVNTFRYEKKQQQEHAKQCLERAINRVSNWAEYCMAQLEYNSQIPQTEWKQFQQEKINLIVREEVFEIPLDNDFYLTNFIIKLSEKVFEEELVAVCKQIASNNLKY